MVLLLAMWQVLLELAPWLLLGTVVAGLLHRFLPPNFIHRQLSGRAGVLKAVALGVPLPLCSCGVIPAGLGLSKDGASDGASVGFLISTPQTGVDSVLVSASFLGWPFALFKVASAAITGLIGGLLTDTLSKSKRAVLPVASTARKEKPSWRSVWDHGLDILRTIWRWLVIGIIISAAISTYVPTDVFTDITAHGHVLAMVVVLAVSIPLYVCATASVPIAAALVAGGFPTGAALVFLMAGPATNVATIGAIYRSLGRKALGIYLTTIIGGSIAFGLTFDFLLESGATPQHHHHAGSTWWAIASAVLLIAFLSWFAYSDLRRLFAGRSSGQGNTIELSVSGMSCGGCVARLERVLRQQEGVSSANVTLEPGKAVVCGTIEENEVRQVIEAAGFTTA